MIGIGITEILVSQIPNFHKLSWLSVVAAVMSFVYSSIGLGLAFAKVISGSFPLFCSPFFSRDLPQLGLISLFVGAKPEFLLHDDDEVV